MNVLIYVITILMLLSILSYASWDNFRTFAGMQAGFIHYMQVTKRQEISQLADQWYDKIVVGTRSKTATDKPTAPDATATSRVSFNLLLNPDARQQQPEAYEETRALLKQLIIALYGKEKFFQEQLEKRPHFLDEMLDEIRITAEQLATEQQIKRAIELSTLELPSPDLHYTFYLMLHGMPQLQPDPVDPATADKGERESQEEFVQDETVAAAEAEEEHAPAGYQSLLDFITVKPTAFKTRVYLASPAILMAIYDDATTVDQILELRRELYREIKRGSENLQSATERFRSAFANNGQALQYATILDFSVTKTDPKRYE